MIHTGALRVVPGPILDLVATAESWLPAARVQVAQHGQIADLQHQQHQAGGRRGDEEQSLTRGRADGRGRARRC